MLMTLFQNLLKKASTLLKNGTAKKITATDFLAMILENPSVFEHWETPLEITDFIDCSGYEITHLSPHLTFSGKTSLGFSANFSDCKFLKIATGTFKGFVNFRDSSVTKIEALHVGKNKTEISCNFSGCKLLQLATGNFEGFVNFYESGIQKIENLRVQNPNEKGYYAEFRNCPNIHGLENWDLSKPIGIEPKKLQAEIKRRAALKKFHKETQTPALPFL
jgi:hypothetical protein